MKKIKLEIKWAIIFIVMMLLWMIMERLAGFHDEHIDKHPIVTNFIAVPAITIYVLALLDKRKKFYGGFMTYKEGFASGLMLTLIITIFSPLTQYITSMLITPHYFANAIKYAVDRGHMTREMAETYFNLKSYLIQTVAGTPVMGLITTAVVAIFTKKKG